MHITFHSYSLSLFFLQIKPFYTDTFYLHKLMEITPKTCGDKTKRKKDLNHTAGKV